MAYTPPVNIPSLSGKNYAGELYGMFSGVGDAFYQNRRDQVGDAQWQSEQDRLNTAQGLAQSNADRNYALELQRFQSDDELARLRLASDQAAPGGGVKYGLNPVTGVDAQGNPVLLQMSDNGIATQAQLPEGVTLSKAPIKLDAGTHFVLLDPITRQPVGEIPKDIAGVAAANAQGTVQGGAAANLPSMKVNADYVKQQIDAVMSDPDLALVTGGGGDGGFGGLLPADFSIWSETRDKGRAIQSKVDFVKAQVFPIAYDLIRGAGPIAIYESQAAAAAISRLEKQNLSDADYLDALADFKVKLDTMIRAVEAKTGGGQPSAQSQGIPLTTPGGVTFQKVSP